MSNLATIPAIGDFEACAAYRSPIEHDEPVCAACGHLADDHEPARTATVLAFTERRRARGAVPVRKAS